MHIAINKTIFLLIISFLLLMPVASFSEDYDRREPAMKIYYTEFSTRSYAPITSDSIEKWQDLVIWLYGKHKFIDQVQALFEGHATEKKIDQSKIRLKTVIKKASNITVVYLVDYHGVVLRIDTGNTYSLSKEQLIELGDRIIYFHGVVDQRPTTDPW